MGVHRMLHTLFLVKFGVIDYSLSYLHSNFDVGHSSTLVSPIGQICTYIYNSNSATWCHGNTISNSSVSQIFYHYLFFSEFFFQVFSYKFHLIWKHQETNPNKNLRFLICDGLPITHKRTWQLSLQIGSEGTWAIRLCIDTHLATYILSNSFVFICNFFNCCLQLYFFT